MRLGLSDVQRMLSSPAVPHVTALALRAVGCDGFRVIAALPYAPDLAGNPETGVLHGGAVTAFLDSLSAIAVHLRRQVVTRIATIDLRMEYFRSPQPGRDLLAEAECHRAGGIVAFTRALAYHDPGEPIVAASGTFMLFHDQPAATALDGQPE